MKKWKKVSEEVFYPSQNDQFLQISKKDIIFLKSIANNNERKRARFCGHLSTSDDIQEMVIFHRKNTYIRPHKHLMKTESYLLLEGEIDMVLFDDEGNVIEVVELGDYKSGKPFFYRLQRQVFRSLILKTNAIFLEVKRGPFKMDNILWAKWAPHHEDSENVRKFCKKLDLILLGAK